MITLFAHSLAIALTMSRSNVSVTSCLSRPSMSIQKSSSQARSTLSNSRCRLLRPMPPAYTMNRFLGARNGPNLRPELSVFAGLCRYRQIHRISANAGRSSVESLPHSLLPIWNLKNKLASLFRAAGASRSHCVIRIRSVTWRTIDLNATGAVFNRPDAFPRANAPRERTSFEYSPQTCIATSMRRQVPHRIILRCHSRR